MHTLHAFGCSFTLSNREYSRGTEDQSPIPEQHKYLGRLGYAPDIWSEALAKKIGFKIANHGKGGSSNPAIFERVCKNSPNFNKGDIVIIQWSNSCRFRWADPNGEGPVEGWHNILPGVSELTTPGAERITLEETLINRDSDLYVKEVHYWTQLVYELSRLKGFELYIWSIDNRLATAPEWLPTSIFLGWDIYSKLVWNKEWPKWLSNKGYTTIRMETGGQIPDDHPSEQGHASMAEIFYKHILKYSNLMAV
jgi:hypothetical protein